MSISLPLNTDQHLTAVSPSTHRAKLPRCRTPHQHDISPKEHHAESSMLRTLGVVNLLELLTLASLTSSSTHTPAPASSSVLYNSNGNFMLHVLPSQFFLCVELFCTRFSIGAFLIFLSPRLSSVSYAIFLLKLSLTSGRLLYSPHQALCS